MSQTQVRRTRWREEPCPQWLLVGMTPSDAALWMFHARHQSRIQHKRIRLAAMDDTRNIDFGQTASLVLGLGQNIQPAIIADLIEIRRGHPHIPMIIWMNKRQRRLQSLLLEAGVQLVIDRYELIPTACTNLLRLS